MARSGLRSREKLAVRSGYSRTQLHAVEAGKTRPTDRFLEKLEELERAHGLTGGTAQNEQSSPRLAEPPPDLSLHAPAIRSDAEITGLAALLNAHAARVQAGEAKGDLPDVRRALEQALRSRGALPRE